MLVAHGPLAVDEQQVVPGVEDDPLFPDRNAARPLALLEVDDQALQAFTRLARLEGIIPALESSHAVAECIVRAPKMSPDELIIVNLSGRGDKDVAQVAAKLEIKMPI